MTKVRTEPGDARWDGNRACQLGPPVAWPEKRPSRLGRAHFGESASSPAPVARGPARLKK